MYGEVLENKPMPEFDMPFMFETFQETLFWHQYSFQPSFTDKDKVVLRL